MTTIKSYTDLEQSRKLAEILPIESADMYYECTKEESEYKVYVGRNIAITYNLFSYRNDHVIPCWSLAALLDVLTENKICHYDDRYYCQYMSEGDGFPIYSTAEYDNPVDTCVAMIEKLHELNLL